MDVATLLRATESVASEMHLERLTGKLISVLVATSGADAGALVVCEGERLLLRAAQGEGAPQTTSELRDAAAERVLRFAQRTRETIALREGDESALWQDPYFVRRRPKALLCVPLLRQGKVL